MKFRQWLAALCVIIVIPALWVTHALGTIVLPEVVLGATIMAWGTIITFYFGNKDNVPTH